MQFSVAVVYAISTLILVHKRQEVLGVAKIAEELNIPPARLRKVCIDLRAGGLLSSHRGVEGGYSLAKRPELISVLEIVRAMEKPLKTRNQLQITARNLVLNHPVLKDVGRKVDEILRAITLADIIESEERDNRERSHRTLSAQHK